MSRGRSAALIGAGSIAALGGVLLARATRHPNFRAELERGRQFVRKVEQREPTAPVPPPLPPGSVLTLAGRGETFVRDTGGDGPPVLLLHGWTASADLNWFAVFDRLVADGHRVVALDHRGHGRGIRSDQDFTLEDCADDAAAVLRTLGLPPAVVVGYSMGGPIAMHVGRRHPELVAGLVLEATALSFRAAGSERLAVGVLAAADVFLRLGTADGLVERALRDAVNRRPDLEPLIPWMGAELGRCDPRAVVAAGRAVVRHDARAWASELRETPTTVVITTEDRLVRPSRQRRMASALGADTLELRADHDAPAVAQEAFAEVTAEAIAGVRRRATALRVGQGANSAPSGISTSVQQG